MGMLMLHILTNIYYLSVVILFTFHILLVYPVFDLMLRPDGYRIDLTTKYTNRGHGPPLILAFIKEHAMLWP